MKIYHGQHACYSDSQAYIPIYILPLGNLFTKELSHLNLSTLKLSVMTFNVATTIPIIELCPKYIGTIFKSD